MKTRTEEFNLSSIYHIDPAYDIDNIVYFDIETTGFSAASTYLYLIGVIYHKNSSYHLIQWFSEDIKEEILLIQSFFAFIKSYDYLVHYNGTGFDLPYLKKKCQLLNLPYHFDHIKSIDLYKKIIPYKPIFQLRNYKQKTIERFLNVNRQDTFDGGDLIEIYQNYIGKKQYEALKIARGVQKNSQVPSEADQLLHFLFLHNEEDLKGLLQLCSILIYIDLFQGNFCIMEANADTHQLNIQLQLPLSVPTPLMRSTKHYQIKIKDSMAQLTIPIYNGKLKYYYNNYRDYYYLPTEDTVVHKSLATFVDREHKKKVKPQDCYTIKSGAFVPQFETIITPSFKFSYNDKISYVEVHTDTLLQEDHLTCYVKHLLSHYIT